MISRIKTVLASRISTASPCIQRRIHVGQRRQVPCNSMSPSLPPATGFTWPQRSVASSGTEAAEPPKRISSLNHRGSIGYVSCWCIFKIHVKLFQGCVWFVTSATSWRFTNGRITNHLTVTRLKLKRFGLGSGTTFKNPLAIRVHVVHMYVSRPPLWECWIWPATFHMGKVAAFILIKSNAKRWYGGMTHEIGVSGYVEKVCYTNFRIGVCWIITPNCRGVCWRRHW